MTLHDSPLAETLAAAQQRFGGHDVLATRIGRPAGWQLAAEATAPGGRLESLVARQTLSTGTARADIGGTWLVEGYAWALAVRAVGVLLVGTRVPALARDATWLHVVDDSVTAVALSGPAYGLSTDPRTGHHDLRPVDDEAALLDALHAELGAHLTPLVEAVAGLAGRSRAALWRSAGDRLGGAFLWLGEALGARERAWTLGGRCMESGGPLGVGAGFRLIEHAGVAEATRDRRGCCLMYRTGDRTTCFTCPLTPERERRDRLEARAATIQPAAT